MKTSVALCTFNGSKFLKQQLDSIINQSHQVDEIVICDDNSTDDTLSIITEYSKMLPSKIKIHLNGETLGVIKNFEKAINLCTGDVIFLSDHDDVWYRFKVEKIMACFKNDESALLYFTNADIINENGKLLRGTVWSKWGFNANLRSDWRDNKKAFSYLLDNKNKITGATVAFKAKIKAHIFPFNLPENYYHDAWLGLVSAGLGGLRFMSEPTIQYRVHKDQQVGIGQGITLVSDIPLPPSLISKEQFTKDIYASFTKAQDLKLSKKQALVQNLLARAKSLLQIHNGLVN